MDIKKLQDLLRLRENGQSLYHREGQELEFKEQFNLAGLAEYFRDFAAFANNKGGYLVFGVKDSPRVRIGLSNSSIEQFEKIDPEKISGYLLDIFSSNIEWEQDEIVLDGMTFGFFCIQEAKIKPIIAKKDEGRDQTIKNGEVYYRYGGRTQKIQYGELEAIINSRVESNNRAWVEQVRKIGEARPENAAILDTERSVVEYGDKNILVVDEALTKKIKFIREGKFDEKDGATTLKLVGDVRPIDRVEVVQRVKEKLIRDYPFTALEMSEKICTRVPGAKQSMVWSAIKENDVKKNLSYATHIFSSKRAEDVYKETGDPGHAPVIYNDAAVDFLAKILANQLAG